MILIKNLSFFLDKKYKFKFVSITFLIFIGIILETFSIGSFIPLLNFIVKGKEYFLQNSFIQKNNHLSNFFENNSEKEIILIFLISLILLFILKNLFLIFLSWKKESFNFNLRSNLSSKLFKGFLLRALKYEDY